MKNLFTSKLVKSLAMSITLSVASISSFTSSLSFAATSNASSVELESAPLASWNEGKSKQSIINFVAKVTQENSKGYVKPEDRIAVFDNDGTLWAEQPLYTQLVFAIERIYALAPENPKWQTQEPFAKLLKGDIKGALSGGESAINAIVMVANAGMTNEEYAGIVKQWFTGAKHSTHKKPYAQMAYQPMLELIDYLHSNDFKVFIVSGGGIEFIRAFAQDVYNIPSERVIGSVMKRSYQVSDRAVEGSVDSAADGKKVILREAEMAFYNNNANKVLAINSHIGKRPIAAFGNSDGDLPMLQYTTDGDGERLSMIIHHTDETREWAYDKKSHIGHLSKGLEQAKTHGWHLVDMKNEWKKVFSN